MRTRVYFGTTYLGYRKKLASEFAFAVAPESCLFGEGIETVDLVEGTFQGQKIPTSTQRVLLALSKGLYAPQRVGTLHERLYPQNVFHPETSAKNVYESIRRARRWIEKNNAPIRIEETKGQYFLQWDQKIRIPARSLDKDITLTLTQRLEAAKLQAVFTAKQASDCLGISLRTLQREMDLLISQGKIEKLGRGRSTCYRLASSPRTH